MRVRTSAALLAAALAVAACGSPEGAGDTPQVAPTTAAPDGYDVAPGPEPEPEPEPDAEPPVSPPPAPEPAAAYELADGETGPAAKRAAADLAQGLTTYEPDESFGEVVARVTDDPELARRLEAAGRDLHHEGAWSRGEIVYPQLGGLEDDASAVITVVRQQVGHPDGSTTDHTRTLDIRVDLTADGQWRVSELASAGGHPVPRPDDLSAEAAAVLDDDRIELPDTARWDIHRGAVDDTLLALMARIAERTPYGVVVLETGHSREVFGTDRTSRHAEGRAVDIHRLGDSLVIDDRARGSATHELVEWLYEQPELSEVGSPWALDGFGGRSFTDELHQDHLHVGVLRPGEKQKSAPRT
ncbi:hypothetical protein [Nitriliruptor alkaliphilus]|uniref:hypothetical protein n=1 Tax=Nitriliruptor alkaliphilus TaxID=427918 RepID=UPI000696FC96|nr:hypothetical protein [Nitriliruptor alkaliphilus]